MQSVLVTIDRHEWYAPPQIYTRNDIIGFWVARPAMPPESPLLSSTLHRGKINSRLNTMPLGDEPSIVEHKRQYINENSEDGGYTKLPTDGESVVELSNSGEDSTVKNKRQRVEEDFSEDGSFISNGAAHEHKEQFFKHSPSLENSGILDDRVVAATNASLAEQAIEPTLVMFEVNAYATFFLYLIILSLFDYSFGYVSLIGNERNGK